MGIIFADARHLLEARQGRTGGKAVTLGRLTTYLHPSDLRALRKLVGDDADSIRWLDAYRWGMPADGFFRDVLKFDSIDSVDFSEYQGATIIHDLSRPLPAELELKFDLAVDGGTLEHVFNFPVAVANLMRLVRPGGLVYSKGPCNNLCGHGFYQFSPELMYRIFSPQNGFAVRFVRLAETRYHSVEATTGHAIYEVTDPDSVGRRVNLVTSRPVLILTLAERVAACEPFAQPVLQSDYVTRWKEDGGSAGSRRGGLKELARRYVPTRAWTLARGAAMRRAASWRNSRHFKRVR
ncbi:MAG TPA: hypothetical protein VN231_00905 [Allosphingosinicella sp.]|nr:hypothetical protein [Allosphingosinicella sp.]